MEKIDYILEEKKLSEKLCEMLSKDFDIITEKEIIKSPGQFFLNGTIHRTIPDLIIKPKKHLIESNNFIDTIIPVEIKKLVFLETKKFEDLMFQCHSYRFSKFNNLYPKLCLYFIDDYFESNEVNTYLRYDYELSKDPKTEDYETKKHIMEKKQIETLFGRFGIGEIVTTENGFVFRLKRQILFSRNKDEITFKPKILNFWWGTRSNSKSI
jgi:hypothetical protein